MVCGLLAKRGIPSIMFTLPYYAERGNKEIRKRMEQEPQLYIQAIEQSFADIGRVADVLASRPEVDKEKISLTGISLVGFFRHLRREWTIDFIKSESCSVGETF
jgi:dienelactone hydrolase